MQITSGRDVRSEMREMRTAQKEEVPVAVSQLRADVRRLADDTDPRHEKTVETLKCLADAVRTLPDGEWFARKIEIDSAELARSARGAVHSDFTRRALGEATVALENASRLKPVDGWPARIEVAKSAVWAIDDSVPYLKQRPVIDRAFVEVANAFVVGTAVSAEAAGEVLGEHTRTLTVHRWAGDRRGESPNIEATCGGPATTVVVDRTPADVTAAVFTFGWYTPVHVHVTCPRAFNTASR